VSYTRRTPADSELPRLESLEQVDRFIRMLDADGYPRAFITHGAFRLELSRCVRYADRLVADVTITVAEGPSPEPDPASPTTGPRA
jgi:methionyl-tRNA formyltransferase